MVAVATVVAAVAFVAVAIRTNRKLKKTYIVQFTRTKQPKMLFFLTHLPSAHQCWFLSYYELLCLQIFYSEFGYYSRETTRQQI